ncbi:MAG: DNA replication/repair protein RecF [Puniceicoccaceae bacterium]
MKIRSCNLENFRNIGAAALRFDADRVFLVGRNGQGKSNLLEALGLLHAVRSFRTADLRHLIACGEGRARVYCELLSGGGTVETVLIEIHRTGGRSVVLNGEKCPALGEFLARFPSVVLAAEDIGVIRGSPAARRRLFDLHFASVRPGYYATLREYYRGLAGRNRLLKTGAGARLLRAHDIPLAELACRLRRERREATAELAPAFAEIFRDIAAGGDEAEMAIRTASEADEAGDFLRKWESGLERDRLLGSTQSGPHRDDWIFSAGAGDARDYASDGQQRNLALALKLALFRDLRNHLGADPVLLADDILGELDSTRKAAFWGSLPAACQVIATGTEFAPPGASRGWEVHRVEAGTFARIPPDGEA